MTNKSQYTSAASWCKDNRGDYISALRQGHLEAICEHYGWKIPKKNKPKGYWTNEKIIEEALKYNSPVDWMNNSGSSYTLALKDKELFDRCISHMNGGHKPRGYWTEEIIIKSALKYATKKEWKAESGASYGQALKNKELFIRCVAHMEVIRKPNKLKQLQ